MAVRVTEKMQEPGSSMGSIMEDEDWPCFAEEAYGKSPLLASGLKNPHEVELHGVAMSQL